MLKSTTQKALKNIKYTKSGRNKRQVIIVAPGSAAESAVDITLDIINFQNQPKCDASQIRLVK